MLNVTALVLKKEISVTSLLLLSIHTLSFNFVRVILYSVKNSFNNVEYLTVKKCAFYAVTFTNILKFNLNKSVGLES